MSKDWKECCDLTLDKYEHDPSFDGIPDVFSCDGCDITWKLKADGRGNEVYVSSNLRSTKAINRSTQWGRMCNGCGKLLIYHGREFDGEEQQSLYLFEHGWVMDGKNALCRDCIGVTDPKYKMFDFMARVLNANVRSQGVGEYDFDKWVAWGKT